MWAGIRGVGWGERTGEGVRRKVQYISRFHLSDSINFRALLLPNRILFQLYQLFLCSCKPSHAERIEEYRIWVSEKIKWRILNDQEQSLKTYRHISGYIRREWQSCLRCRHIHQRWTVDSSRLLSCRRTWPGCRYTVQHRGGVHRHLLLRLTGEWM